MKSLVQSMTFKLVLAFLLTSVAGVALASLFIRQSIVREFDSYVIAQQRAAFIDEISGYYARTGSWQGVDRWLRDQFISQRATSTTGTGEARRDQLRVRFMLADASGNAIIAFGPYNPGEHFAPDLIASGTPIMIDGRMVGSVITPDFTDVRNAAENRYLSRTDSALSIAALVMVGVALVLGVLLARVITRPARELTVAAQRIASGDLEQRVPVRSRDELGVLAAQFNQMSADLGRALSLRRQMTADVAHDLRTPLTVIAGYLEALRDEVLKPTPERFATMYDETQLLLRLVDDLHTLSLADAGELTLERRRTDARTLLERVAETYWHVAERGGVALRVETADELPDVCVDVEQFTRVLSNLVSNALRYTPPGGEVRLLARPEAHDVALIVGDTGIGIAAEHLPSIFERFYRADQSRQQATGGSGLGLAIAKSIVEAHQGQISATSTPDHGTTFTITLPASGDECAQQIAPSVLPHISAHEV